MHRALTSAVVPDDGTSAVVPDDGGRTPDPDTTARIYGYRPGGCGWLDLLPS